MEHEIVVVESTDRFGNTINSKFGDVFARPVKKHNREHHPADYGTVTAFGDDFPAEVGVRIFRIECVCGSEFALDQIRHA